MAYLRLRDYYQLIQDQNLKQIIRSDDALRLTVEQVAQSEVIGYLVQKYDVSQEFTDLLNYDLSSNYVAHQLVQLDGVQWSNTSIYSLNDIVVKDGLVYYSLQGANLNHNPTTANTYWGMLGNQYALFHIPFPYPKFSIYSKYVIGNKVSYKGKVYQCQANSIIPDHQAVIQFGTYNNVSNINSAPDDGVSGLKQWGVGYNYSFNNLLPNAKPSDYTAWSNVTTYVVNDRVSFNSQIWQAIKNNTNITPDTDISAWQPVSWLSGDDRSGLIVQKTIDITLYHLHASIAPSNIPELRNKRYEDAIMFLKDCANGNITLDSPLLEPKQGHRIRWGGNIKNNNTY